MVGIGKIILRNNHFDKQSPRFFTAGASFLRGYLELLLQFRYEYEKLMLR